MNIDEAVIGFFFFFSEPRCPQAQALGLIVAGN